MEGWSLLFTFIALGGVLLTFAGAWWAVRTLRAKRPRPGSDTEAHDGTSRSSTSSGSRH